MINHSNKIRLNIILIFVFFIGIFVAFDRASNFSDRDAYTVILSYLNYIDFQIYNPSRGAYGHPLPEILIGSLAYFLGTPYSNIFCFICFFFSIYILFKTFFNSNKNIYLFFFLIFSNYFLFIENTNSIDYPIALLFFSLGLYFLKENKILFFSLFFGLTIASRANFLTFIYPILIIHYFDEIKKKNIKNYLKSNFILTIIAFIFYLPLLKTNNFTLDFLDLPLFSDDLSNKWYGGPEMTFEKLMPRFIFKIYLIVGVYSSLVIIYFSKEIFSKISFDRTFAISSIVIFFNLAIYYFMPTKILIINPFIIFLYIILFRYFSEKIILILIFFNLLQWIISYNILDIKYKNINICDAKEAISANLNFSFKKGYLFDFIDDRQKYTKCYSIYMGTYEKNFIVGKPLILSK